MYYRYFIATDKYKRQYRFLQTADYQLANKDSDGTLHHLDFSSFCSISIHHFITTAHKYSPFKEKISRSCSFFIKQLNSRI